MKKISLNIVSKELFSSYLNKYLIWKGEECYDYWAYKNLQGRFDFKLKQNFNYYRFLDIKRFTTTRFWVGLYK